MASIDVGGDTSVKWTVDVDQLRPGTAISERRGETGLHQEGIDETDDGQDFTISIKLPSAARKDPKELARCLKSLIAAMKNPVKNRVVLKIPIERGNMRDDGRVDQIRINWKSSRRVTPPPTTVA